MNKGYGKSNTAEKGIFMNKGYDKSNTSEIRIMINQMSEIRMI